MAGGRPTIFTTELAEKICELTAESDKSLKTICIELGISISNVRKWLKDADKKEFADEYARAKEEQADFLAEQILEIADDSSEDEQINPKTGEITINQEFVQRSKLRIDARKWVAAKLKPKKYGEKTSIDHTTDGKPIQSNLDLSKLPSDVLAALIAAQNTDGESAQG